jgi:hypothetical protein
MKQRKLILPFAALLISLGFSTSCSNSDANGLEDSLNSKKMNLKISKEELDLLIQSFPSPIETSLVIKNAGNPFNSSILIPTKNLERFVSNYDKALAMGAFGGDMGYINIYEKSFVAMDYLGAIRMLSKDLEIDQFFDFDQMISMAKNSSNADSLLQMSTESFNKMEAHFRDKGRNELSILIVLGTWLEGSYIISNLAKGKMTDEMKNRVAEQKESVVKLADLLRKADSDPYFSKLSASMNKLKSMYDKITIEQIIREPEMQEINGELVFIDKSETKINATKEQIAVVIDGTMSLRDDLLK